MDPTVIYFEKLAKNSQIERKNFKLFENFLGIGGLVEPQLLYRKWFWLSEVNRKLIVGLSSYFYDIIWKAKKLDFEMKIDTDGIICLFECTYQANFNLMVSAPAERQGVSCRATSGQSQDFNRLGVTSKSSVTKIKPIENTNKMICLVRALITW